MNSPTKSANILNAKQAALICEAHDIDSLLENDEELEMLKRQNPELLKAYKALQRIAAGGKA